MPPSFELKFTNPNAVFLPNQALAGSVVLNFQKTVKARGLRLIVKGKAECNWSETTNQGKRSKTVHYQGKQVYLNSVSYLFGSPHGETIEVPAGIHTYNFECLLPAMLPYSVEGRKGFIRYKVEATLDIPWGLDLEAKKPFIVKRYDDLNLVQSPNYRQPSAYKEFKTFGCLCWKSKPVIMTMRVDKTGFAVGDRIPIHMQMDNRSKNRIYSTKFKLIRTEQYTCFYPPRTTQHSSTVTSKTGRGVRAGETVDFVEYLEIPPALTTSNSFYCSVFKIQYHINCTTRTGWLRKPPLQMNIAIAIGNVGIIDAPVLPLPLGLATPYPEMLQVMPTAPFLPPALQPLDDLPPSFEEATKC